MKTIGIIGTAMLSLLLGIAGPAYAQNEGEKQDHPKQQDTQHEHQVVQKRVIRRQDHSDLPRRHDHK